MGGRMNAHLRDGRWMPCRSRRCAYKTTIFHDAEAMKACNALMEAVGSGCRTDRATHDEAMRRIFFLEAGSAADPGDMGLAARIGEGAGR